MSSSVFELSVCRGIIDAIIARFAFALFYDMSITRCELNDKTAKWQTFNLD